MRLPLATLFGSALLTLSACTTAPDFSGDPYKNYDQLWETLDKHYGYFDVKLPAGTTWRDLYHKHRKDLRPGMTSDSLFLVMTQLLGELKDGHVNLTSTFDFGRYWAWKTEGPRSFDPNLLEDYLGEDYHIAGGISYRQLPALDGTERKVPIGYMRVASFATGISDSNISAAMNRLRACHALIIDIRNNGGGQVTTSDRLAQHFIRQRRHIGYIAHKTGPAHDAFSPRKEMWTEPLKVGTVWLKPTVVLTNQGVYSAANDFTLRMKGLPHVKIVGWKTGGGGGLPMSSELPNGWGVRFSSARTYDASGKDIEFGIDPDFAVRGEVARTDKTDRYIEAAAALLTRWVEQILAQQKQDKENGKEG